MQPADKEPISPHSSIGGRAPFLPHDIPAAGRQGERDAEALAVRCSRPTIESLALVRLLATNPVLFPSPKHLKASPA
ncbi:hypothetical protein AGIG_G19515 [Arapaima gigas]